MRGVSLVGVSQFEVGNSKVTVHPKPGREVVVVLQHGHRSQTKTHNQATPDRQEPGHTDVRSPAPFSPSTHSSPRLCQIWHAFVTSASAPPPRPTRLTRGTMAATSLARVPVAESRLRRALSAPSASPTRDCRLSVPRHHFGEAVRSSSTSRCGSGRLGIVTIYPYRAHTHSRGAARLRCWRVAAPSL